MPAHLDGLDLAAAHEEPRGDPARPAHLDALLGDHHQSSSDAKKS